MGLTCFLSLTFDPNCKMAASDSLASVSIFFKDQKMKFPTSGQIISGVIVTVIALFTYDQLKKTGLV